MEQTPQGRTGNAIALRHWKESYQTEMKLELSSTMSADTPLAELWSAEITAGLAA